EKTYTRARELCREIEATPELFPVLWGLCLFHFTRAEHHTGQQLAEEMLRLAQGQRDTAPFLAAHLAIGTNSYGLGEFVSAQEHLEKGIRLYDHEQHRSLALRYGRDL